jgi:hypothetical protein
MENDYVLLAIAKKHDLDITIAYSVSLMTPNKVLLHMKAYHNCLATNIWGKLFMILFWI